MCNDPGSCPFWNSTPPEHFQVLYDTTEGKFTVTVNTQWAPPFAKRFWLLSNVGYMNCAPFYRVNFRNASSNFVVQFGYSGRSKIDQCWDNLLTDNTTWSVHAPGNVRGTVAFSMNAVENTGSNPNCTSEAYCAQGFSTNIFINYNNNTRLDAPGFAIIGTVDEVGMEVVDRLYHDYGEVQELCSENSTDIYCRGTGPVCEGISMDKFLKQGLPYQNRYYSKMSRVLRVTVLSLPDVPLMVKYKL